MKINNFIWTGLLLVVHNISFADPTSEPGKLIFVSRCASCHNINKDLVGPALAGLDKRHNTEWIINFIHSPQKIIKSGDAYATALFNRFNNITMPDHADLKEGDIKSLIAYINAESKQVSIEKPPFSKPGKLRPLYVPLSLKGDYDFFLCFLALVSILIGVMLFAVEAKTIERKSMAHTES